MEPTAAVSARPVALVPANRGIVVGAVVAGGTTLGLLAQGRTLGVGYDGFLTLTALLGFAGGAVVAFSSAQQHPAMRRQKADLVDAGVAWLWCALALFGWALAHRHTHYGWLLAPLLLQAAGFAAGAFLGVPLLRMVSRFRIKGLQPFQLVVSATERIQHPDVRFVTRVAVQVLLAAALLALAAMAAAVIAALLALALVFWLVSEGSGTKSTSPRRAALWIPKGGRVRSDGRVAGPALIGRATADSVLESPTGQRIDEQGRVWAKGAGLEEPTGLRVDADGRVWEKGALLERPTGVKLADRGGGEKAVELEGTFLNQDTGVRVRADGHVEAQGSLGPSKDVAVEIDGAGNVRVDGEPRT